MVSRAPQPSEALTGAKQTNGKFARRNSGQDTPTKQKRVGGGKQSAQDVAELKDYVGSDSYDVVGQRTYTRIIHSNSETVLGKEPLDRSTGR